MQIKLRDGEIFSGSSLEIATQMKSSSMFTDALTIREYVATVIRNTKKIENLKLNVNGNTDEELAQSLVREIIKCGLAREV